MSQSTASSYGTFVAAVRAGLAVTAGKLAGAGSRALGRGGGTALPGLIATRIDSGVVAILAAQLGGSAIVSGTNGKTTTSRMLDSILTPAGYRLIRNRSGSNLSRGVATALLERAAPNGSIPDARRLFGVFEVDEAALPGALGEIRPRALLLLNLFRDQLDRYGEVATVARLWAGAIASLDGSTRLVANADDPLIADVAEAATAAVYFGIESADGAAAPEHASDVKACPRCGGEIAYSMVFLGHLGHYFCPDCGFSRPTPALVARNVRLAGTQGSEFELASAGRPVTVRLPLPGLYNVYNALAAAAAAVTLGVDLPTIGTGLAAVTPAFGRMEQIPVDGRDVILALAKNPAGLNEVMRTLVESERALHLLMLLNDNTADGHDVSWIWDADVELLQRKVAAVTFGGTRAPDMALRFKYADALPGDRWAIQGETERALRHAIELTPEGGTLFIVPTYTALLDVRSTLAQLGYARPYWED